MSVANNGTSRLKAVDSRIVGVVEATVKDAFDPEQQGRVCLHIPCMHESTQTEWCPVCQFYAGGGYGAFFAPEIDDVVLVAFIHGELARPVVIGGLYNGTDKPNTHRDQSTDVKQIRTKKGHQITFDDTDGKLKIEITDAGGHNTITLDPMANSITVEAGQGKLVLKGQQVEITGQSSVTIDAASINIG